MATITGRDLSEQSARDSARKATLGSYATKGFVMLLLVLGSAIFLIPFYVMMAIALKSEKELGMTEIWQWPQHPTLENFRYVITNPNVSFGLFLRNTAFVSTMATLGVLFSSSVVAYAFGRLKFPGRDRLFLLLLSTMMLPGIVTMIPTYVLFAKIGWFNSFKPLTVPAFFGGGAFNIFLLRQFMMGIPKELDEAAVLDGASHWTIYSRIILPLSSAALATVGVLAFIYNWKDFMGPLLYLNDPDLQTNELGLSTYNALQASKWHLVMAGSVLVMIPIVVIFFVGQRYFVKGLAMTGGK
jgi:ABC-type glycerol-3-phosphate transport system permease component